MIVILASSNGEAQATNEYIDKSSEKAIIDSISRELEKILIIDQKIRSDSEFPDINAPDSVFKQYTIKADRIDSINGVYVSKVIDKYGWLERSKIGGTASVALFMVVQHGSIEMIEKYLPKLKEVADMGEAKLTHYCLMLDRLLMDTGKKQVYGTQASSVLRENGGFAIWPIENPENVNDLRKRAGFKLTIEEYAKELESDYDPNEKLPSY